MDYAFNTYIEEKTSRKESWKENFHFHFHNHMKSDNGMSLFLEKFSFTFSDFFSLYNKTTIMYVSYAECNYPDRNKRRVIYATIIFSIKNQLCDTFDVEINDNGSKCSLTCYLCKNKLTF